MKKAWFVFETITMLGVSVALFAGALTSFEPSAFLLGAGGLFALSAVAYSIEERMR